MIRVATVDDHPAVRVGLHALLRAEPGLVPVALSAEGDDVVPALLDASADVALLDGQLEVGTGLEICLELSRFERAPRAVVYSAYMSDELAIAARVAGAAGALAKSAPLDGLLDALREVAGGGTRFPPISPWALRRCAARVTTDDLPLLSMLAQGTTRDDAADALAITPEELRTRLRRVVTALEDAVIPAAPAEPAADAAA